MINRMNHFLDRFYWKLKMELEYYKDHKFDKNIYISNPMKKKEFQRENNSSIFTYTCI